MNNQFDSNTTETNIDLRSIINKAAKYWYLFVISFILCFTSAFLYNKFATPIYQAKSSILIKKDKKAGLGNAGDLINGFGLFDNKQNIENEIAILKSYPIISEAVKLTNLAVTYYENSNFMTKEFYPEAPFVVQFDSLFPQAINVKIEVTVLSEKEFLFTAEAKSYRKYNFSKNITEIVNSPLSIQKRLYFGQQLYTDDFNLKLFWNNKFPLKQYIDKKLSFNFNSTEQLTQEYQKTLKIEPLSKQAEVITVTLKDDNREKIVAFINNLTNVYQSQNLSEKSEIAVKTISFIDEQLASIHDSLNTAESNLESFRQENNLVNIKYQSSQISDELVKLDNSKSQINLRLKYYTYIQDYIVKNKDISSLLAPTMMDINDPLLNDLLSNLNKLYSERSKMSLSSKDENPALRIIDTQIKNIKNTLVENIKNAINSTKITIADLDDQIVKIESQVSKLPKTERLLLGIERNFKVNDEIFTYLLQKRSEAAIAKASTLSDNKILECARLGSTALVAPDKKITLIIAAILTLLIPFVLIIIKDTFHNVVEDTKTIEHLLDVPILGTVSQSKYKTNLVLAEHPKSIIAEQIRTIRTKLQYFSVDKEQKVILITSSVGGEGKSFFVSNLGISLAFNNKKTLIMGVDLRKPKLFDDFGISNNTGLSSLLIGAATLDQVVKKTKIENLYLLPSGPIPPNPAELIESQKMSDIMEALKKEFDVIIVDSPPFTLVTDSLLLSKYCDSMIYMVRHNYTKKEALSQFCNFHKELKIKNIGVVFNGYKHSRITNGYGYGYGYGYYEEQEPKQKIFNRIFTN